MSLGIATFIGLAPQMLFVGGSLAISSIFIPLLLKDYVPDEVKLKQFSDLYEKGKKVFFTCSILGTICYAVEAYMNRNNEVVFPVALTGAILSISPVPFTALILPLVEALKNFRLTQPGKGNSQEINALLKKWGLLNLGRVLLSFAGVVNTLYFIGKKALENST